MIVRIVNIVLLIAVFHTSLDAQIDTTLHLAEVAIVASNHKKTRSVGDRIIYNSQLNLPQASSLTKLLNTSGLAYAKNSGPGSSATVSMRGGSSSHTLVTWNGVPIQNTMLGQTDVSLVPVQLFEKISLKPGGDAAAWGSGSVAGTITLDNENNVNEISLSGGVELTQYQGLSTILDYKQSISNFSINIKYLHDQSENNYDFRPASLLPIQRQHNAQYSNNHVLSSLGFRGDKLKSTFYYWYTTYDRNIPPTVVQTRSMANQEDKVNRLLLENELKLSNVILKSKLSNIRHELRYVDSQTLTDDTSLMNTWYADIYALGRLNSYWDYNLGLVTQWLSAQHDNYADGIVENRNAINASIRLLANEWNVSGSLRWNMTDGNKQAIASNISAVKKVRLQHSNFLYSAKIRRLYRQASLNERYWQPGGNSDLEAEHGWGTEVGIEHNLLLQNAKKISYTAAIYSRNLQNYILWSPLDNGSIWRPQNIGSVWSRGVELSVNTLTDLGKFSNQLSLNYRLNLSTFSEAITDLNIDSGNQLWYVPKHTFTALIESKFQAFSLSYNHTLYSSSIGVNDAIDSYNKGLLRLSYDYNESTSGSSVFIAIDNVWNVDYQVIERRPMPRRIISFGIKNTFST